MPPLEGLKGKELTVEDLGEVGHDESSERLETLFTAKYMKLKTKGYQGTKLVGTLLTEIFQKDIYFQTLWQLIYAAAKISSAFFLSQMLKYVQNPETTVKERYMQTLGLFISFIVAVYATHQFNFNLSYVFNKIKTGIMGMIFRKSTKLSHHAAHIISLGKIVNFNAADLNNFEKIHFVVSLVLAPIILIQGWGLLYYFWGINSLVGVAYIALLWPLQSKAATSAFGFRKIRSKQTDDRIEGIIEGIQGIEVLKYYNWDLNFIQKIKDIRSVEFGKLKAVHYRECISRAFVFSSHWIASFLIYVTCTLRGEELKAYLIFPTIYLMTSIRQLCVSQSLQGFLFLEEFKMAAAKINLVMGLSEIENKGIHCETKKSENAAEFENFSAFRVNSNLDHDVIPIQKGVVSTEVYLNEEESTEIYQPVLENINLSVKKGDLVAIIGDSGSGKSSVLLSFINEFAKTSGEFRFQGKHAYVAQETVFFPGPLRDCIVFGKHYDEKLFWEVLEVCCLAEEVKALPNQEMTEIVEKGTNLSEGQRARISLARAIYSNADVYLLDECLSNLSMKVAKSIFHNCIQGWLKNKTVIMATNLLNLAKYANKIVVMEKGTIITQGTYEELIENDVNVGFVSALKKLPKFEPTAAPKHASRRFASAFTENIRISFSKSEGDQKEKLCSQSQLINADPDLGLYYEDERLDEWNVTYKIYWKYLAALFNWKMIIPAAFLFVGSESISWLFTLFIAKWRTGEWTNNMSYIIIGTITAVSLPLSLLKYLFYFNRALNASNKMHNKMLTRLFHSPMKFFDRNPSGRIINRFSNDMGILDKFLISGWLDLLEGFVSFWVTLAALWTRQLEIFISFAVLVGFCGLVTAWSYKALSQTRGLELATRSPMYSLFLIGVRGLGVVRGHGQMEDVIRIFYKKADDYSKAHFAYMTCVRFMSFVIDYLIELVVIATFAAFLSSTDTPLSSGFFVNKLGNLPTTMQWILRDFIKLHLLMASAARVINYCQKSKSEGEGEGIGKEKNSLTKGKIEMNNIQMRYSEKTDLTVDNLTLNIEPGEKIAIFSHSKGGVTSLIGLLTRLYEFEKQSYINSYIKIDGADIDKIPISSLRESITVIPQISVLFKETIRNNLDPWKQYTDEEIWSVIDFVGLREVIEVLDRKLDTKISSGSHIFSLGQQQLLCLARGLLKKSLVFVQDEATSHLDFASEQDIQKRLLKKYEGTTVINITHRLLTISNYDKVLTVQNGKTIDFGEPYLLLVNKIGDREITKKEGCFATAVINMGQKTSNEIFRNAMVTYYEKHNLVLPQEEDPIISNQFFEDDSDWSNEENKQSPQKPKKVNEKIAFEDCSSSPVKARTKDGQRRSSKLEERSFEEIPRENRKKIVVPNLSINKL